MNLRFFFNSPRYSEDMDLDVVAGSHGTLKKNGYKILKDASFRRSLATYGIIDLIVGDATKAKHTETTQRFKVQLIDNAGDALPTKIEFSYRSLPKNFTSIDNSTVYEPILPEIARAYARLTFSCHHYHGAIAVMQKILALGGRAAPQCRDVFDLAILERGGFSFSQELKKKINKPQLEAAKENLLSLDFEDFKGQVIEYLEASCQQEYSSRKIWDKMKEHLMEQLNA